MPSIRRPTTITLLQGKPAGKDPQQALSNLLRNALQAASARFLFAAWRSDWEARTDHDHRAILDALRKGQTEFACSTLARHVGWIGKRKPTSKNADIRETYEIPG